MPRNGYRPWRNETEKLVKTFPRFIQIAVKQTIGSLYKFVEDAVHEKIVSSPESWNIIEQDKTIVIKWGAIFERSTMDLSPYSFAQHKALILRLMKNGF